MPEARHVLTADVIAVLSEASDRSDATAWVDLVTSERGQQVLRGAGFLPAP